MSDRKTNKKRAQRFICRSGLVVPSSINMPGTIIYLDECGMIVLLGFNVTFAIL